MNFERAVIIKSLTSLEQLLIRHNTRSQAQFYIEHNGGDFSLYESQHEEYQTGLAEIQQYCNQQIKTITVEREYLTSFLFDEKDLVIVVGPDGLVANAAKYVQNCPIIGVNVNPSANIGKLLAFDLTSFLNRFISILQDEIQYKTVYLAKAQLNDGQELLAFNDFFIGKADHTSARYRINYSGRLEQQSSSGILVSTKAGSTAWLSSIMNEFRGLQQFLGLKAEVSAAQLEVAEDKLCFVVREPYRSPATQADVVSGYVDNSCQLEIESMMPEGGIIFSDGIMNDYLQFNSGSHLKNGLAKQRVKLIQ